MAPGCLVSRNARKRRGKTLVKRRRSVVLNDPRIRMRQAGGGSCATSRLLQGSGCWSGRSGRQSGGPRRSGAGPGSGPSADQTTNRGGRIRVCPVPWGRDQRRRRQRGRCPLRIGPDGGRAEEAGLRVRRHQPRFRLSGAPRITPQSRRQHRTRNPDVSPRRSRGGDGARLRKGRGQADGRHGPRHGGHAARLHGVVPGLGRPRSRAAHRGRAPQPDRHHQRPAQRAGHGRHHPRLREVRRRGDDARAVCGIGDARVPRRDDAADGAGRAGRAGGTAGSPRRPRHPDSRSSRFRRRPRGRPAPSARPRACW